MLAARGSRVTFGDLLEKVIDSNTSANEQTLAKYRSNKAAHLDARLGHLPIEAIRRETVTDWIHWMRGRDKSAKTIANVHALINATMEEALRQGYIDRNPCAGIRLPKDTGSAEARTFLAHREAALLLEHIRPDYQDFVRFLLATGLRFGEATALRGLDVDLFSAPPNVSVTRAWKQDGAGKRVLGLPKSARSRRVVSVDPDTAQISPSGSRSWNRVQRSSGPQGRGGRHGLLPHVGLATGHRGGDGGRVQEEASSPRSEAYARVVDARRGHAAF